MVFRTVMTMLLMLQKGCVQGCVTAPGHYSSQNPLSSGQVSIFSSFCFDDTKHNDDDVWKDFL